ncbi:MAG: nuclear transport factor 2 family protein [Erythrobacter sp.]|uniref:YybH family protein n=1 Tax=Erythrobacter sp. TaxID=1042 RepID=UPI00260ABCE6|nr:nuclear transport factor 2 family protein [Erythrobacter sp.]MDJ0977649.1 nuclear transport factor 2 family protein [Erythrobacter sp.]
MSTLTRTITVSFALAASAPTLAEDRLSPGIWTNTEDTHFAKEEGREKADWVALEVAEDGAWRRIDAFGEPLTEYSAGPIPELNRRNGASGWQYGASELRKARRFSCWVSARKFAGKPDGSSAWTFANRLSMFDQGGRVFVPGNGEAPDVTIRMRNVTWATGSRNKPSLVLYVHKDDPERAESYSWASPDASLVGVNLRWVQGSCSRAENISAADREAQLAEQGARWRALYEAQNWEALRQLYADDAVLMTQGQAKIEGAAAIITYLQRLAKAGGTAQFAFENEEVVAEGSQGFVTARYRMDIDFPGRETQTVVGRSFLVYKWDGTSWKLWRDMDNSAPDLTPDSFAQ